MCIFRGYDVYISARDTAPQRDKKRAERLQ